MNDSIRVIRRPQRARPPTTRTAAAVIATAGLALLAAACASPSSTGSGGSPGAEAAATVQPTNYQKALAYSGCMRSHGVSNFPNPDSSGNLPASAKQIAASTPRSSAAQTACQHLLPNSSQSSQGKPPPPSNAPGQPSQGKPAPPGNGQSQPSQGKPTPGGGQ
jgi:hypothetical protein